MQVTIVPPLFHHCSGRTSRGTLFKGRICSAVLTKDADFRLNPDYWGLCKVRTGWRQMAERKMRMMKCGWKIAYDKMRMENCV